MKELFKKAHQMAKEIKAQYPEVDYSFQFSLCLKFLKTAKEEVMESKINTEIEIAILKVVEKLTAACPVGKEKMLSKIVDTAKYVEQKLKEQAPKFEVMQPTVKGMVNLALISGNTFSSDQTIRTISYMVRDEL